MSSETDKIKGATDKAIGNAKQGIGHVAGDKRLETEGKLQEVKGHAEKAVGNVKGVAKDAANAVADNANRKF